MHKDKKWLTSEGGKEMSGIKIRDDESIDNALRRFKRDCARSGVLQEVRKREHYEKPSVKRKKKSEAARKRKYYSIGKGRMLIRPCCLSK